MSAYIYLPVPTAEMLKIANAIISVRSDLRILQNRHVAGWRKGVSRSFGGGCLRALSASDTLYLVLHGTGLAGSSYIAAKRTATDVKRYTPIEVAELLEAEGLSKNFRHLHLYCCGSGLVGGKDPQLHKSIAQRVWSAMKSRGYNVIRVTGYLGDIKTGVGTTTGIGVEVQYPDKTCKVFADGWNVRVTFG